MDVRAEDTEIMYKLIFSLISITVFFISSLLLKRFAKKTQNKFNLDKSRYFILKKLINLFVILFIFISLIYIWGIDVKNLWMSITGLVAMVAVAFFAVWSLIGNILAGILIYFTTPFKINDTIEILPDNIKGKVLAINSFFILLVDEDGDYINMPNSFVFQKYIKNIRHKK